VHFLVKSQKKFSKKRKNFTMSVNLYKTNRDEAFGMRFRMLAGYYNLTLKEIADKIGCAVSTVGMWSKGRIPASQEKIEKLAQLLNVSPSYLISGVSTEKNLDDTDQKHIIIKHHLSDCVNNIRSSANIAEKNPSRAKIEHYLAEYLDKIESIDGGLDYVYYNLIRTFPKDFLPDLS
jgi:transcriptional regulator with XRE-family HTH domain